MSLAFEGLTTHFDDELVSSGGPATSTNVEECKVFTLPVTDAAVELPASEIGIDDLVALAEGDESMASHLVAARRTLADHFNGRSGTTIRTLRLSRGMSQSQLAIAISSSQSHVARIESGGLDPNYNTFMRLARALGTSTADIVNAFEKSRLEERRA